MAKRRLWQSQNVREMKLLRVQAAAFLFFSRARVVFTLCRSAAVSIAKVNLLPLKRRRGGKKLSLTELLVPPCRKAEAGR